MKEEIFIETKKQLQKIPRQLTKQQVDDYILEYLQLGKRGFAIKIPLVAIINAILYVIYTGCQWEAIDNLIFNGYIVKCKTVYYHFNRWAKLGCFKKIFESSQTIPDDIIILDSTYIESSLDCTTTKYSGYKHKNSTKFQCFSTPNNKVIDIVDFSSGNNNDLNSIKSYENFFIKIQDQIKDKKIYLLADSGYDSKEFKNLCHKYNLIAVIGINNRNSKVKKSMDEINSLIYKTRYKIEKVFAWVKSFKAIKLRNDIKNFTWNSKVFFSFFLINMKNVLA